jgi:RNA polymerase sigma factor (sigma-70 family)
MATAYRSGTLGLIQHLYDAGTCTGLSDARLLERFVSHHEERAFAALVARHGAMVLNTCQAVLKDPNAAEDAFQATFVLLFRKAGSIRECAALGGWLHRVAYRVALQARSDATRRRSVEMAALSGRGAAIPLGDELGAVLHEEIERLPERFRLPVVLCDLEGMSRDQAADLLRSTEGAVRGRLAKGRALLRRRLTRRGITLALPPAAPGEIPASLVSTAIRAAAGDGASGPAVALAAVCSRAGGLTSFKAIAIAVPAIAATVASFVYLGPALARPRELNPSPTRPGATLVVRPQPATNAAAVDGGAKTQVEGRILDLEGRPVAGAQISVKYVQSPPDGNLDAWIDEVKRLAKEPFGLSVMPSPGGTQTAYSAKSGRDGRFRIGGLPKGGIATAAISCPGFETSEIYILTRDVPAIRVKNPDRPDAPMLVYYGARFDHVVASARPIVGTVRDKDTGAPIPGVHITGMPKIERSLVVTPGVEATSDAQGRYTVTGLPTSRGFKLFTEAAAGQPYVNGGFVSPATEPKPGPFTFDITLKRGVMVRGRLTDKVTRKPVEGAVTYHAFEDNSHLEEYPNFTRDSQVTRVLISGSDGRFAIAALPGRGLISARAPEVGYLHSQGAAAIKGFDKGIGAFKTRPFYCPISDQHVFTEINPEPGTSEINLELQVDPGRTVKGSIIGPDNQPIDGVVEIRTLDVFQGSEQSAPNSATFQVTGLPTGPYRLDFIHRGRKLAGSIKLSGDEDDGLIVKLEPWGTLVGRIVDEAGKPRTDVEIFSTIRDQPDPKRGDLMDKPTVDAEGRFRIDGLVPGVKYDALGHSHQKANGPILRGVQVAPGEVKDLGDIKLPAWKPGGN